VFISHLRISVVRIHICCRYCNRFDSSTMESVGFYLCWFSVTWATLRFTWSTHVIPSTQRKQCMQKNQCLGSKQQFFQLCCSVACLEGLMCFVYSVQHTLFINHSGMYGDSAYHGPLLSSGCSACVIRNVTTFIWRRILIRKTTVTSLRNQLYVLLIKILYLFSVINFLLWTLLW
jgi:hypothetical protein